MESSGQQKLLAQAEALLAKAEREVANMRQIIKLLKETMPEQLEFDTRTERESLAGKLSSPKASEQILRNHGKPMHIDSIIEELEKSGFNITDKVQFKRTLYSNLIRQKHRFHKTKPNTFGLAKSARNDLLEAQSA